MCTRGRKWTIQIICAGFGSKQVALKFESALQEQVVGSHGEWPAVIQELIATRAAFSNVRTI